MSTKDQESVFLKKRDIFKIALCGGGLIFLSFSLRAEGPSVRSVYERGRLSLADPARILGLKDRQAIGVRKVGNRFLLRYPRKVLTLNRQFKVTPRSLLLLFMNDRYRIPVWPWSGFIGKNTLFLLSGEGKEFAVADLDSGEFRRGSVPWILPKDFLVSPKGKLYLLGQKSLSVYRLEASGFRAEEETAVSPFYDRLFPGRTEREILLLNSLQRRLLVFSEPPEGSGEAGRGGDRFSGKKSLSSFDVVNDLEIQPTGQIFIGIPHALFLLPVSGAPQKISPGQSLPGYFRVWAEPGDGLLYLYSPERNQIQVFSEEDGPEKVRDIGFSSREMLSPFLETAQNLRASLQLRREAEFLAWVREKIRGILLSHPRNKLWLKKFTLLEKRFDELRTFRKVHPKIQFRLQEDSSGQKGFRSFSSVKFILTLPSSYDETEFKISSFVAGLSRKKIMMKMTGKALREKLASPVPVTLFSDQKTLRGSFPERLNLVISLPGEADWYLSWPLNPIEFVLNKKDILRKKER